MRPRFYGTAPDLNPIKQTCSKLKAHLRRTGARTYDRLIAAIADTKASATWSLSRAVRRQECDDGWGLRRSTGVSESF
jgi:transposase